MDLSRRMDVSLQNRYRYRYFVSDYDLKQYVKAFFEKPAVFVSQSTIKIFLGRSQCRNQGEWDNGASAPFSQVI